VESEDIFWKNWRDISGDKKANISVCTPGSFGNWFFKDGEIFAWQNSIFS